MAVAAARTNHHGGPGRRLLCRQIDGEGWLVPLIAAFSAGGAVGPEQLDPGRAGAFGREGHWQGHQTNKGNSMKLVHSFFSF
jgi:hypothetical protein